MNARQVFVALWFAFAAVVCLSSTARAAEGTCTVYSIAKSWDFAHPATGSTRSAACTAWASAYAAAGTVDPVTRTASGEVSGDTCHVEGTETTACIEPGYPTGCGVGTPYDVDVSISEGEGECEETDCAASAGNTTTLSGSGDDAPVESCEAGCKATVYGVSASMGGNWVGTYRVTAESCTTGSSGSSSGAQQCVTGSSGLQYCKNATGGGTCGYVNDQFVCLKKTPTNGCQSMPDGSKVCTSTASTPPAPDNGTPGEKATPDDTLKSKEGSASRNYEYFGPVTVGGSSAGSGGGATPEPGDGDDEGEEGPGECEEGGCEGALPNGGEMGEVLTFEGATSQFMGRVAAAPLVASVSELGDALPAGSCPSWTIEVFDREISLSTPMCTIWDSIAGLLSAVMLVAWGLLAARIVLSA